jgi:hypothetical protein
MLLCKGLILITAPAVTGRQTIVAVAVAVAAHLPVSCKTNQSIYAPAEFCNEMIGQNASRPISHHPHPHPSPSPSPSLHYLPIIKATMHTSQQIALFRKE